MVDFLSLIYGATVLNLAAGIDVFVSSSDGWQNNIARRWKNFAATTAVMPKLTRAP